MFALSPVVVTSRYHLVTRLIKVTDLLQVVPTKLIQAVRNKLLRACWQTISDLLEQLVASWPSQPCYNIIATYLFLTWGRLYQARLA